MEGFCLYNEILLALNKSIPFDNRSRQPLNMYEFCKSS